MSSYDMSILDTSTIEYSILYFNLLTYITFLKGGYMDEKTKKKYCPMTETTFYTLLALLTPNHGYGIIKFIKNLTDERVKMGTGTLYTMLGRLVDDEMIEIVSEDDGKKTYRITQIGINLLKDEQKRLKKQCENGERILGK